MNIKLRLETPDDHYAVEMLTRDAFWGMDYPECDEHYLVHLLRNTPAFIPELNYVAELDGKIAGHIIYSKSRVIDADKTEHEILTFGPISVLPEYQKLGIGSKLIRYTIEKARELGYRGIIIYGHPEYYPRFGFQNAKVFDITTPEGGNFDYFMACPLYDGAFDGISGALHIDEAYKLCGTDKEGLECFNEKFPYKEPAGRCPAGQSGGIAPEPSVLTKE